MVVAVGIVLISHIVAKIFSYFPAAILDFPLISMSQIINGCTIEFRTPENMGVAIVISSLGLSSMVPDISELYYISPRRGGVVTTQSQGLFGVTPKMQEPNMVSTYSLAQKRLKMKSLQLY